MQKRWLVPGVLVATLVALPSGAFAQTFPPDSAWLPLTRNGVPVSDPVGDANGYRDIVGDDQNPAEFVYSDGTNLFFRLRLNQSPLKNPPADVYQPFTWACELDTDAIHTTYDLLASVDGNANRDE